MEVTEAATSTLGAPASNYRFMAHNPLLLHFTLTSSLMWMHLPDLLTESRNKALLREKSLDFTFEGGIVTVSRPFLVTDEGSCAYPSG